MKAAMATFGAILIAGATSVAALAQAPATDTPMVPNAQTTQRSTTEPSHDMSQMKAAPRKMAQHRAVMSRRQIDAVQAALNKINQMILENHLRTCVTTAIRGDDPARREAAIGEILDVFAASKLSTGG